jgi:hypothetical protein
MERFRLMTVESVLKLPNRLIALFPGQLAQELPHDVQ